MIQQVEQYIESVYDLVIWVVRLQFVSIYMI